MEHWALLKHYLLQQLQLIPYCRRCRLSGKWGTKKIAESFFICCLYLSDKKNIKEFKGGGHQRVGGKIDRTNSICLREVTYMIPAAQFFLAWSNVR